MPRAKLLWIIKKNEINKAEDPAAKLLEKETEYAAVC
jgi:hypothetical protein